MYSKLKEYFNYEEFMPGQEEIINAILFKKTFLSIIPKKQGKSFSYKMASKFFKKPIMVLNPFVADISRELEFDQAFKLKSIYIDINNMEGWKEAFIANYDLVYLDLKSIENRQVLRYLAQFDFDYIVLEEAYYIYKYMEDRQDLVRFLGLFDLDIGVLSSIDSPSFLNFIKDSVGFIDLFISQGPKNNNIKYKVFRNIDKKKSLKKILKQEEGKSLIYCRDSSEILNVETILLELNLEFTSIYANLTSEEIFNNLEEFKGDKNLLLLENNLLITRDMDFIDNVIYYTLPESIEDLYEKTELVHNNINQGEINIFFIYRDGDIWKYKNELDRINTQQRNLAWKYKNLQDIRDLAYTDKCIREKIFSYGKIPMDACNLCSNCLDKNLLDITDISRDIFKTIALLDARYGIGLVVDILRGDESQKVRDGNFQKLETFGLRQNISRKSLQDIIRKLISKGYIFVPYNKYWILENTSKFEEIYYKDARIYCKNLRITKTRTWDFKFLKRHDKALYNILRVERNKRAVRENIKPYRIVSNNTLKEIAIFYPTKEEELLKITGVGRISLEKYGQEILEIVGNYIQEEGVEPVNRHRLNKEKIFLKYKDIYDYMIKYKSIEGASDFFKLSKESIMKYLRELDQVGYNLEIIDRVDPVQLKAIRQVLSQEDIKSLGQLKSLLPKEFSYEEIKLCLLKYNLW